MDTDVWAGRWAVDGEGGGGDGGTFDAKYLKYIKAVGPLHPALHRNCINKVLALRVNYSKVQYSTVQYSTLQYITVQYSI